MSFGAFTMDGDDEVYDLSWLQTRAKVKQFGMNTKSNWIVILSVWLVLACSTLAGTVSHKTPPKAPSPKSARVEVVRSSVSPRAIVFALAHDATITVGTNLNLSLNQLRVGEVGHVSYTIENGVWLAHQIVVNPVHHQTSEPTTPAPAHELHAQGKILAYDLSAGTLSIRR